MAGLITIDDGNAHLHMHPPVGQSLGLRPRDFTTHPVGCYSFAKPFDLPLIPRSEWPARLAAQKAAKAQLTDIRNISGPGGGPIPSRDQNGKGYCWAHSSTSAALMIRAIMGEPYEDLSAYAVACIIKGYRDEGGWGAESLEWIAANGIPTSEFWPQQSMLRSNDNPAMRANAALHKYTDWRDLDPEHMVDQLVTALLMGFPLVSDFNWWSHSVCTVNLESVDSAGNIETTIWNSWGDSWSANGMGKLSGRKAIPDSALVALVMTPSQK